MAADADMRDGRKYARCAAVVSAPPAGSRQIMRAEIALPRLILPQTSSRGRFAGGAEQVQLDDDEEEPLENVSDSSTERTSSSRRAGPFLFTSDRKQFGHRA